VGYTASYNVGPRPVPWDDLWWPLVMQNASITGEQKTDFSFGR
jgi:hypothetical protein